MKTFLAFATATAMLLAPAAQAGHARRTACGSCAPTPVFKRVSHPVAAAVYPQQSSQVSTTSNSLSITNYYQYSQPAAQQGGTTYGYTGLSYGQVDLGGLLSHYARLAEQGQQGQLALAQQLGGLIGEAKDLESEKLRVTRAAVIGQAVAQIAAAIDGAPDAPDHVQLQQQVVQGGDGGRVVSEGELRTFAAGTQVHARCASCHAQGGSQATAGSLSGFNIDVGLNAEARLRAVAAIMHDDEARRMPRGETLDAQAIGLLIQELSR